MCPHPERRFCYQHPKPWIFILPGSRGWIPAPGGDPSLGSRSQNQEQIPAPGADPSTGNRSQPAALSPARVLCPDRPQNKAGASLSRPAGEGGAPARGKWQLLVGEARAVSGPGNLGTERSGAGDAPTREPPLVPAALEWLCHMESLDVTENPAPNSVPSPRPCSQHCPFVPLACPSASGTRGSFEPGALWGCRRCQPCAN